MKPFVNSPVANYRGELYSLPFNMNTFYQLWGVTTPEKAQQIIEKQIKESGNLTDELRRKASKILKKTRQDFEVAS